MAKKKNHTSSGTRSGGTRMDSYPGRLGHAPIQQSDLNLTRPNMRNVPSRIPKQISAQIVFDVVRLQQNVTSSLTVIVEQNFGFSLSNHPEASSWAALFDQWCIPQVSVSFSSLEPPGALGTIPTLNTAIDFDNTTALGSATSLLEFENAQNISLGPGVSHTRACRPCVKPTISGGVGVDRMWCDSASPGSNWNGIRLVLNATPTATCVILAQQTIWFAFRNGI